MLRALGLRHREISEITGDRPNRVARLIANPNLKIYEILEERAHDATVEHASPRAERLWQLERDTPSWLISGIGRAPGVPDRPGSPASR